MPILQGASANLALEVEHLRRKVRKATGWRLFLETVVAGAHLSVMGQERLRPPGTRARAH